MPDIKIALNEFNPWWKDRFSIEFKEREIYREIQRFMPLRQVIAFTGLRGVGKTTLMLKVVEDAIKKGLPPQNILYFSFDEFRETEIREIMKAYEEMLGKDLRREKHLFLLDEIQKLSRWEAQLKVVYDTRHTIKILISGSESLFIKKKSKETLAGRIFEFKVEPLSFKEYLSFREVPFEPVALYEKELAQHLDEFILTLGFPELVGLKDKTIIKKYIRESVVEKIVYKDLAQLFKIKDIAVLEALLNVFMEEPGQMAELAKLASELKISRQTLSSYLTYLEESFLIRKLYNFSRSRRKVERKLKKYYPTILSPDLLFRDDEASRSRVFECLIVNQLKAEFFWRDPYKNEVDIVLGRKEPVPLKVKYGKIETSGILAFLKKFKVNKGVIISRNIECDQRIQRKMISAIPAFKFLLK